MKHDLVFIDLETTGLRPDEDKVIEIAAISKLTNGLRKEYSKLINPGRSIPSFITRLTGITEEMLVSEGCFYQYNEEITELLQNKIIVAHNAMFDIPFLQAELGKKVNNVYVDTCELAQILYPSLASYSLRYLARVLNLQIEPDHRAMQDTLTLEKLFYHLYQQAKKLPLRFLQEASSFLKHDTNGISIFFEYIIQSKIKEYDFLSDDTVKRDIEDEIVAARDKSTFAEWNIKSLQDMLRSGGLIAQAINGYQERKQQIHMTKAVGKAFEEERILMIEAGTGTGKSLAYLLPAIFWSLSQAEKVVVATNTIALQDQLMYGEISFLQKVLSFPFLASVLKGRSNYLCINKYLALKKSIKGFKWKERLSYAKITSWLEASENGDRDTINLRSAEADFFMQLASSKEHCLGSACQHFNICYYQKARKKASQADILIVNHSLLLSDIRTGENILPKYRYLIIDEAHHLDEEGTKQFSETLSLVETKKCLNKLLKRRSMLHRVGLLAEWRSKLKDCKIDEKHSSIWSYIDNAEAVCEKIQERIEEIQKLINNDSKIELLRIQEETRNQTWWQNASILFENMSIDSINALENLNSMCALLINDMNFEESDSSIKELKSTINQLQTGYSILEQFIKGNSFADSKVFWLEKDSFNFDVRFNITPLNIGNIFHDLLFVNKVATVLTSATLSINDSFSYFIKQLGLPEDLVDTIQIQSPFLYGEQSILMIDDCLPDPANTSEELYNLGVKDSLFDIISASGGNTLVLFTAIKQMRYMFDKLYEPLREKGLELYADGINGRRHILTEELKNNKNAVVFGANTFWEGIDLPGKSLTTLIIMKLPFLPPNTPIMEARAEELKKNGKDGFYHLSLPQAVLRFRQGYGRLIRTIDDIGVVIVLDNRIIKKRYGRVFIKSLPEQKYFAGDTKNVVQKIQKWFQNN